MSGRLIQDERSERGCIKHRDIPSMPTWPGQWEQESIVSKIREEKEESDDNTSKMRFPLSTRVQIEQPVFGRFNPIVFRTRRSCFYRTRRNLFSTVALTIFLMDNLVANRSHGLLYSATSGDRVQWSVSKLVLSFCTKSITIITITN